MQSSFCKRRSLEHEMLTFKVYANRFLAAMLADRMLLENISDSEKKGCKNVSEQRRCRIWSKTHWKMAGNDRVQIDFPSVSIKRSYLSVYTQFLHSIDISICSCYSLNAIFNCGSILSYMVQWLPVNILSCKPHKKETFSGHSVTLWLLIFTVLLHHSTFLYDKWKKTLPGQCSLPRNSVSSVRILWRKLFWPVDYHLTKSII